MLITDAPEGATHAHVHNCGRVAGGQYCYYITYFKCVDDIWMIYKSDTDNEYPGWGKASRFDFVTILTSLVKL